MASDPVLYWYGEYDYNYNYTWDPENNFYFYEYQDELSSYTNETKMRAILDEIVQCNYTGIKVYRKENNQTNDETENDTGLDTQGGVEFRTYDDTKVGDDTVINLDNRIDSDAVCGISDADLTAAMHYTQEVFLIS